MEITSLIVKYVYKVFISNSIYVTEDRQSEWQERAPAVSNLLPFTTCGTGEIPHSSVHLLVFKLLQLPVPVPQLCVSNSNATVNNHRLQCFVRVKYEHNICRFICKSLVIAFIFIFRKKGIGSAQSHERNRFVV